jgi:hypothetical protein
MSIYQSIRWYISRLQSDMPAAAVLEQWPTSLARVTIQVPTKANRLGDVQMASPSWRVVCATDRQLGRVGASALATSRHLIS